MPGAAVERTLENAWQRMKEQDFPFMYVSSCLPSCSAGFELHFSIRNTADGSP